MLSFPNGEAAMIVVCPSCQARYKFDEAKLGGRSRARTNCAKCGGSIDIENPLVGAGTLPPSAVPATPVPASARKTSPAAISGPEPTMERARPALDGSSGTITGRDLHKAGLIELPKDKRFSLAVIQGAATGQIYGITKTRTLIGRSGQDVNLDDPEASRQHAALEILGETAILRDLDSTNGTFLDVERIQQQVLTNQMEFRIGSHVLMFIVTDVE
jgi:predicted Zn finger-like uncharacterized protein